MIALRLHFVTLTWRCERAEEADRRCLVGPVWGPAGVEGRAWGWAWAGWAARPIQRHSAPPSSRHSHRRSTRRPESGPGTIGSRSWGSPLPNAGSHSQYACRRQAGRSVARGASMGCTRTQPLRAPSDGAWLCERDLAQRLGAWWRHASCSSRVHEMSNELARTRLRRDRGRLRWSGDRRRPRAPRVVSDGAGQRGPCSS